MGILQKSTCFGVLKFEVKETIRFRRRMENLRQ